jgi:outer membrane protein TolC|tara:strand:+ start:114 stop:1406 length:1293 start_codon:yes stop_codon:yes gene_type:complete
MIKSLLIIFSLYFVSLNTLALNIDDTIKNTVKNNSKIKIGLEKLQESKELIEKSYGAKLPNITSQILGTYSNSDLNTSTAGSTTPEYFTDKYKLTITQNLFDAGFNDLEIERSKILFENELINFKISVQNLILDAITGYLLVINYENALTANEKNFDSISKALEEIKIKFKLGSSTLYELQNAESAYAIAKVNLFTAEQNLEVSKKSFKNIVGVSPIDLENIIDVNNSINVDSVIKNAKEKNLNILLILSDIKNKEILLLKERKTKKPNIDLSGSAEYSDGTRIDKGNKSTIGSISLTITIPLFQQGIDDSNIRKYTSQILQSEFNLQDYRDNLEILILNTFKDFKISEAKMNSNLAVIKASKTALEILNEEYDIGTKSVIDIVDEEGKLLSANVDYLNSKRDYLVNYFKIKSLDSSLMSIFEKYLPKLN